MAREKSDIEKKLESISSALRNKIETNALYKLTDKLWCKKHNIQFEERFNPEENFGFVKYPDARQRTAVEIVHREAIEQERKEVLKMYDYRKRLLRKSSPNIPSQESEDAWYI